jgi:hypothetical protein
VEHSPEIDALATALSKAQGEVKGAVKDSDNPAFKRDGKAMKYADLESVEDACWAAITGNGLAVLQSPGLTVDGVMHMTTMLTHASGQWVKDTLSIPLAKVDAQGYGSAVTYARRYSLAAFMGVAPEDDDGNAASRPGSGGADNTPKRGDKLEGPYTSMTALKAAYEQLDRNIRRSETVDDLEGLLALDSTVALMDQLKRYAGGYVTGSDRLPAEHVPLLALISQTRTQLQGLAAEGAEMVGRYRAG